MLYLPRSVALTDLPNNSAEANDDLVSVPRALLARVLKNAHDNEFTVHFDRGLGWNNAEHEKAVKEIETLLDMIGATV